MFISLGYEKSEKEARSIRIIPPSGESPNFGEIYYQVIESFGRYRTEWEFSRFIPVYSGINAPLLGRNTIFGIQIAFINLNPQNDPIDA
jgi:hypothetical protein